MKNKMIKVSYFLLIKGQLFMIVLFKTISNTFNEKFINIDDGKL